MSLRKVVTASYGTVLVFQAFLLSSCIWPHQQTRFNELSPETKIDSLQNQPKTDPVKVADANEVAIPKGPLRIGVQEAILLAMENNQSLLIERMNPQIQRTFEQEELAVFDPLLSPQVSNRRTVADRLSRAGSSTESSKVDSITGSVSLAKLFATGTALDLEGSTAIRTPPCTVIPSPPIVSD